MPTTGRSNLPPVRRGTTAASIRMPRSARGLLVLAVAAALAAPAASSAQPPGAIAGRVRDAATGLPVAGIEVQVLLYPGDTLVAGRAVTDAAGRYRIDDLFPEVYLAQVVHGAAGYVGQIYARVPCWGGLAFRERFNSFSCGFDTIVPDAITVEPGRRARGVDFSLDRGGVIAGTVTEASTGLPLGGVAVELTRVGGPRTLTATDAEGRYRFEGLAPADYWLQTLDTPDLADELFPGFHCPYEDCSMSFREDFRVRVALGAVVEGIDFALEALGGIAGRVADASINQVLPGMTVTAYGPDGRAHASTETNVPGLFLLRDLPPGVYYVVAGDGDGLYVDELYDDHPCVAPGTGLGCSPALGEGVTVVAAERTRGIDFQLGVGGTISGRVTGSGEALAGIEVSVRDRGENRAVASTDAGGRYRVRGLPQGSYSVSTRGAAERSFADELYDGVLCFEPGRCPGGAGRPVEVSPGAETAGIDFTLEPFGAIAGTLTAAATGEPIPHAFLHVWWGPEDFAATAGPTDQAGRFTSPPLPRGAYYVSTTLHDTFRPFADEVYDDVLCPHGVGSTCAADDGIAVVVHSGEITDGIDVAVEPAAGFICRPTASGVCLHGGRFWASSFGAGAMASPLPLTGEASAFTFADPSNPEAAVRLIDACEPFGAYWVFATGLTDRNTLVTVIDSASGASWNYVNFPEGRPFPAVLDVHGLAVCDAVLPGGPGAAGSGPLAALGTGAAAFETGAPASGPCVPAPNRLCLRDGRFAVEADWELPPSASGAARAMPLTAQSGWFWFFRPQAPELLVKVLDGCGGEEPAFWVFAGGLTDLGVTLRVTDLTAEGTREYINPPRRPFEPVQDTTAFTTCP